MGEFENKPFLSLLAEKFPNCSRCSKPRAQCICPSSLPASARKAPSEMTVVLRIEKGGRGGKAVTVIDGSPKARALLEKLSQELKTSLGTGGTFGWGENGGYLELQGDQRDRVREMLKKRGIRCKG